MHVALILLAVLVLCGITSALCYNNRKRLRTHAFLWLTNCLLVGLFAYSVGEVKRRSLKAHWEHQVGAALEFIRANLNSQTDIGYVRDALESRLTNDTRITFGQLQEIVLELEARARQ